MNEDISFTVKCGHYVKDAIRNSLYHIKKNLEFSHPSANVYVGEKKGILGITSKFHFSANGISKDAKTHIYDWIESVKIRTEG